ncbi:MAG: PD40 domain-containing protein [Acidobacteria bacterium]|nr:PD40 domain-containing protein [Acidobacteriota bacterium]
MKPTATRIAALMLGVSLVLTGGVMAQQEPEVALRAAMELETINGDLRAAIEQYQKIAQGSDRALAAKALIRMAGCYQKLGDAEAHRIYEQVVREYADQGEMVAEARARLAALQQTATVTPASAMVTRRIGPVDLTGSPSGDGRYLSTTDYRTGDVAVFNVATGQIRALTGVQAFPNESVVNSVMSPSGDEVAYTWADYTKQPSHDLRVIATADGAKPRILFSNDDVEWIRASDWSPDGRQVLVLLTKIDRTNQIAVISVADRSLKVLKTFDWRYPANARFSPDGQSIVYDFAPDEDSLARDIFVLAADGSREVPLVEHPADDSVLGWTPDGQHVLFASDRRGSRDAWLIRIADGKVPHAPELIKSGVGNIQPLGLTRNGSFYYGISASRDDVYLAALDPATGEVREPAKKISRRFEGNNTWPDWSPDGRYLAYASRRDGNSSGAPASSWSLLIHALETGQDRELPLSLTNLYLLQPRWSPDGRSLLTPGVDRKGRKGVYRIDAQSGDITRMFLADTNVTAWSGDGKAVFYQDMDEERATWRIMKRELETGRDTELLPLDGFLRDMATSPDGRLLAFCFTGGRLKVMPTSGGNARTLYFTERRSGACSIAWMPDGSQLLLSHGIRRRTDDTSTTPHSVMWLISLEGGEPQKVGLEMNRLGQRGVSIHPDGRRLAFHALLPQGPRFEVWVMENFLPELEDHSGR